MFLCVGFLVLVIILPINCVGDEVDRLIATVSEAQMGGLGRAPCTGWLLRACLELWVGGVGRGDQHSNVAM